MEDRFCFCRLKMNIEDKLPNMKKSLFLVLSIILLCACSNKDTVELQEREFNSTSSILMVVPNNFTYNPESAESNPFMHDIPLDSVTEYAIAEFHNAVNILRGHGIEVHVVEDTPEPNTPDAVFPNNWFSTHSDCTLVLYPMCAPSRRDERKRSVLDTIKANFAYTRCVDLTYYEQDSLFLEGTGSMVLDRINKVAYACLSPRTSTEVFDDFCSRMGYKAVTFHSVDGNGESIYHTNVMMAVCTDVAILCEQSIPDKQELEMVKDELLKSGKKIVDISLSQMTQFAGNMLELHDKNGKVFIVMSETARKSLSDDQIGEITFNGTEIISIDIPIIEIVGGGSIRCMMAELYPI